MCGQNFNFHGVVMYSFLGGHDKFFLAEGECLRHCEYPTYYSIPFNKLRLLISFGLKWSL